jgi:hypothetical protein
MIRKCARCGKDHEMEFVELEGEPIETVEGEYTHWAMCPNTNQPVVQMKHCAPIDPSLMQLLKDVARGDLEIERLMSKVMKRRVKCLEIPEEIGDLDNPLKVVGYEKMGNRLSFILRTERDMVKVTVDAGTFQDVLVKARANAEEGMRELLSALPENEREQLEAPKTVRELVMDMNGTLKGVFERLASIGQPINVGSLSNPVEVLSIDRGDKATVLEFREDGRIVDVICDTASLDDVGKEKREPHPPEPGRRLR